MNNRTRHALAGFVTANNDDKTLNDADMRGVEPAALQDLNQKLEQKEAEITDSKQQLEKLEHLINEKKWRFTMKTLTQKWNSKFGFLFFILNSAFCLQAVAQGTAFTYQGRLNDSGAPANGTYDLRFTIYDSTNLPGVVIAGPLTNSGTIASNGLFTVALDFGAGVFTGPDRWLEIGVRTNGAGAFSTLPARQLIAPTPYAINAANLGGALHVDANNTNGAPNIVGGSPLNQVDPGIIGAVIAGGGTTNYFGNVYSNRVAGDFSVVGGGFGNVNQSSSSVISGGVVNQIQSGGSYSGIASGGRNLIEAGTDEAFIGGGYGNSIRSFGRDSTIGGGLFNTNGSAHSVVAGGQYNLIEPSADSSALVGGSGNAIRTNSINSFIGGGSGNTIGINSGYSIIVGGANNSIQSNASYAAIVGGHDSAIQSAAYTFIGAGGYHQILSNAYDSAIVAGGYNTVQPNANGSFIGGGYGHLIQTNAGAAVIVGGYNNVIGSYSLYSAIVAGYFNTIAYNAGDSFIGSGYFNVIGTNSGASAISAGHSNVIDQGSAFAFIGAGGYNEILTNSTDSAIVAGGYNTIQPNANGSFIGGGYSHTIQSNSLDSFIGGGNQNTIEINAPYSFIGGGAYNTIQFNGSYSIIGGGSVNIIQTNAYDSVIGGGYDNVISGFVGTVGGGGQNTNSGNYAFIGGGYGNTASGTGAVVGGGGWDGSNIMANIASGATAVVPGGLGNLASGKYSFAAGRRAKATNDGTFVWSDSTDADFGSTVSNQFNVRAQGGVRFVTGGAGLTVDGQPLLSIGSGALGLTIQQNSSGAPNVIEGSLYNFVGSGVVGATIGGGGATNYLGGVLTNSVAGDFDTVSGGGGNMAGGAASVISGGMGNTNQADYSSVGGGFHNVLQYSATYSTIAGGFQNQINNGSFSSAIGGGSDNTIDVLSDHATIAGGEINIILHGVVSTIGGGYNNFITNSSYSTIAGGQQNLIGLNAAHSTIAGGYGNQVQDTSQFSTIAGGNANIVEGAANTGTIGGGGQNHVKAFSSYSTIAGGSGNQAGGFAASVGGGANNIAGFDTATVAGGSGNQATNLDAAIPGGANNLAGGRYSFAAGQQAQALHQGSFVWSDAENASFASTISNQFSVRAGNGFRVSDGTNGNIVLQDLHGNNGDGYQTLNFNGYFDQSNGSEQRFNAAKTRWRLVVDQRNATDLMTIDNFNGTTVSNLVAITTSGNVGIGTNTPSQLLHLSVTSGHGEGMQIDSGVAGDAPAIYLNHNGNLGRKFRIASYGDNVSAGSLRIRDETAGLYRVVMDANGFVGIATNTPSALLQVSNATCNGSTWINASDRNLKENFAEVDPLTILDKVAALPLTEWNYKQETASRHIGPMAQDFYAAFNVGDDDKHIATVDESGVALAAIKGLNEKMESENAALRAENGDLKKRLEKLERLMEAKMAKAE
jgi:trimeric autotransporter adhesin